MRATLQSLFEVDSFSFCRTKCPISDIRGVSFLVPSVGYGRLGRIQRFSMKVGHVLAWNYLLCKLGVCPSKTEDVRHECPNSGSTVPFLVQMGQQGKPLALRKIGKQSSWRCHANQVSGELQCGLCLKLRAQIFTENQVCHFWYFTLVTYVIHG